MLKRGVINIALVFTMSFLFSCKDKYEEKKKFYTTNVKKWRNNKTYKYVYSLSSDSLDKWASLNLRNFKNLREEKYRLDSNLYFNSDSTKFQSFILRVNWDANSTTNSDYLENFFGEKIKGKWYFWNHDIYIIPRDYSFRLYDYKNYPTLEQLSDYAIDQILNVYLVNEKKWPWQENKFKINEAYFKQEFETGYLNLNLHNLDQVQKYKIWTTYMKYDTIERRGDYYTNMNMDSLRVKGWDY